MNTRALSAGLVLSLGLSLAGCDDGAEDPAAVILPVAPDVAAQTGAQRLTIPQFRNAIRDLFGAEIAVPKALEPDLEAAGFLAIGASVSTVSNRGVEQYEQASYSIAKQVVAEPFIRDAVIPCVPEGVDDGECARELVRTFGRRVYRRPLETAEVVTLSHLILSSAKALGDFYEGAVFGLAAMLQSPNFIYRPNVGEPDPEKPGLRRYTGYEMASRLSFFLWNSTPDDELLDAAEEGLLTTDQGLSDQISRMLEDDRARDGLRSFVTEWLGLAKLDTLSKDPTQFTYFSPELGPAAREETLLGFENLVFDERVDIRTIMTTRKTFVNSKLASMYQIPAPVKEGFGEVTLAEDSPRRGLLGHASILSLYAHPTSSSATLRGRFVRTLLLCGEIPPPPVDVNTALPEPSTTARTLRERADVHLTDPFCAGCHLQMDPLGLGLENFDAIGRFRTTDNDALIDPSGDLDGAAFADALELGALVGESPAFTTCLVTKLYDYATSFSDTREERETLRALEAELKSVGYRMKGLFWSVAMSPGFRLAREPQ